MVVWTAYINKRGSAVLKQLKYGISGGGQTNHSGHILLLMYQFSILILYHEIGLLHALYTPMLRSYSTRTL